MPAWGSIDALTQSIVPILTIGSGEVRSVEGTGFLLDGDLLTCWHCTRAALKPGETYGFSRFLRLGEIRHVTTSVENFTRVGHRDLAVARISQSSLLPFQLSGNPAEAGDDVWSFGYPLHDESKSPEGETEFTLHPRLFKGHVLRTFAYDHPAFGPTPSLELSFAIPSGLSGGPILRADTLDIVGMAYGNNDVGLVEELSRTDPATGTRTPEVLRISTFGLAHPLEILKHAVVVGRTLPMPEA